MRKLGWFAVFAALLVTVPCTVSAGRVVLLEQTMNVGCG